MRPAPLAAAAAAAAVAATVGAIVGDLPLLAVPAAATAGVAGYLAARARRDAGAGAGDASPARPSDELVAEAFDTGTGLLRERWVAVSIQQQVAAARRKLQPLSVVVFEVDGLEDLASVGAAVLRTLRECDTACRMGDDMVVVVLADTPEQGAREAAERVRSAIRATPHGEALTVWAGIACYPSHALDAPALVERAGAALAAARGADGDRLAIAVDEPPQDRV